MKQDTQKALRESDPAFASFLQMVRKERNIYLEQLAEGLMSASQLARIEKGQRPVHKNMRDRLLGRLGIASDLYENLLDMMITEHGSASGISCWQWNSKKQ